MNWICAPVFPLQGTVSLVDLHCLLLLFINLGEFKTLLPFCALLSPLSCHNFNYSELSKHIKAILTSEENIHG